MDCGGRGKTDHHEQYRIKPGLGEPNQTRFRVVPERAGTLAIPAVQAQIKGRSGRSQPVSVSIQTAPLIGRTAEFLGGIGQFELRAEALPKVVRIGQELDFRPGYQTSGLQA